MSRGDLTYFERRPDPRNPELNCYFVKGEGINWEVLQKEIRRYLGPGAYAGPSVHNEVEGYAITAVECFTPEMLDELVELSNAYEEMVRIRRNRGIAALSYEDFAACRREETEFAKSGTGYTFSQASCQARISYPTAGPWPLPLPPHGSILDSERSNHAGDSAYWSPPGVNCQQDLTGDSESTRALSLSSRTNDRGRRRNDPQGIDYASSRRPLDPRVDQSREYAPSQENAYGYQNPHSSDYMSQFTDPILCSSCRNQARMGYSITLCRACRSKIAPIVESCDKSSSSYNSAVAMLAGLLVGVVAGGLMGAEYTARNIIRSLRR